MKKYLIFDLDGTLINSKNKNEEKVINIIKSLNPEKENQARYILSNTAWMPLLKQLKLIFEEQIKDLNLEELTEKIYNELLSLENEITFFPWVMEKIKDLREKYTLFITTGNSTRFAREELEKAWIQDYFEVILGSDKFLKWPEHIKIFKEKVADDDFCKYAIYIWDGERDREIALSHNISFIHIGNENIDTYEISDIRDIDEIFEKIT